MTSIKNFTDIPSLANVNYQRVQDIRNIDTLIQKEVGQKHNIDLYLTGKSALLGFLPEAEIEVPQVVQYQINIEQKEKLEEFTKSNFFPRNRQGHSQIYDHTLRVVNNIEGYRVIYQCATSISPNPVKPSQKVSLQINQENRGETLSLDYHGRKIRAISAEQLLLEMLFEIADSDRPEDIRVLLGIIDHPHFIPGLFFEKIQELCSLYPQNKYFIFKKIDQVLQKAAQQNLAISPLSIQRLQLLLQGHVSQNPGSIQQISTTVLAQIKQSFA